MAVFLRAVVVGVATVLLCCTASGIDTYQLRPPPELERRQLVQKKAIAAPGALSFVVAATGGAVRFPCAGGGVASSSDSRALLYRVNGESRSLLYEWPRSVVGSSGEIKSTSEKPAPAASGLRTLRYNPGFGFVASVESLEAAGRYVCQTRQEGDGSAIQERCFLLHVLSGSPWGTDRPQVKWLCDADCSTVELLCTVLIVKGSPLVIAWTKNNVSVEMSADPRVSMDRIVAAGEGLAAVQYTEYTSRLVIASAVASDSGSYECIATTFGSRRSASITVNIHSSGGSTDGKVVDGHVDVVEKSKIHRGS